MSEKKRSAAFMSGLRFMLVTLTAVLNIFGCKKESEPTMPQVGGPLANDGSIFTGVSFTDANHGTVTGWGATQMLRSTDGGANWFHQKPAQTASIPKQVNWRWGET